MILYPHNSQKNTHIPIKVRNLTYLMLTYEFIKEGFEVAEQSQLIKGKQAQLLFILMCSYKTKIPVKRIGYIMYGEYNDKVYDRIRDLSNKLINLGISIVKDNAEWYLQSEIKKIWQIFGIGITHYYVRNTTYVDVAFPKHNKYEPIESEINLKMYFYTRFGISYEYRCEAGFSQQCKYY